MNLSPIDRIKTHLQHAVDIKKEVFRWKEFDEKLKFRVSSIVEHKLNSGDPALQLNGLKELHKLSLQINKAYAKAKKGESINIFDYGKAVQIEEVVRFISLTQSTKSTIKHTSYLLKSGSPVVSRREFLGHVVKSTAEIVAGTIATTTVASSILDITFNGKGNTIISPKAVNQDVIVFVCGIGNDEKYFKETLEKLQEAFPDKIIAGYHNQKSEVPNENISLGIDMLEVADMKFAGPNSPVTGNMQRELAKQIQNYIKNGNNVVLFAHSGGTVQAHNIHDLIDPTLREKVRYIFAAPFANLTDKSNASRIVANTKDGMSKVPTIDRTRQDSFTSQSSDGDPHFVRTYIKSKVLQSAILNAFLDIKNGENNVNN